MFNFNNIRSVLLDPSARGQEQRMNLVRDSAFVKGCSALGMGGMGVVSLIALVGMRTFPAIGAFFLFIGVMGIVVAHEVFIIAKNTESMMKGEGIMSYIGRGFAALSKGLFTTRLLSETWVVGPLFGSAIEMSLQDR